MSTKLGEQTRILAGTAPGKVEGISSPGKIPKFKRPFTIVEQLIEGDLQGVGHFLQRFERRNGVAIFDAGDVAAEQPSSFFNITLREVLLLAESTQAVSNDHFDTPPI